MPAREKRPLEIFLFWTMLYKNTLLLQHQLHFPVGINDGEDEVFKNSSNISFRIESFARRSRRRLPKDAGIPSRRKKTAYKFLPYINGRLELAKVYHIDDEMDRHARRSVLLADERELAVWHFKYGGRRRYFRADDSDACAVQKV